MNTTEDVEKNPQVVEKVSEIIANKTVSWVPKKLTLWERFQAARNSKSVRLWLLFILLAIVLYMYFFVGKMKWLLLVIMVVLASAIGLQLTDRDLDLETLWKTQSFTESRVEQVKWLKIIWSDCLKDTVNCSNFTTQPEAQAKYAACAAKIKSQNATASEDEIRNLDVFGLDGDKDGVVCEALPKG